VEIILFAWIFGMDKGWKEINLGADIKVPIVFKYIIQYVTPLLLGWVFINSVPDIVDTLNHKGSKAKIEFYQNEEAMKEKSKEQIELLSGKKDFETSFLSPNVVTDEQLVANKNITIPTYLLIKKERELEKIRTDLAYRNSKIEDEEKTMLYKNISRLFLLVLWLGIAYLVYIASKKSKITTT
jgi:NSS family neurotransmitter:Na+ symporter